MGLNEAPLLFNFEVESSENFTYIPMSVRFNLDRFGLRISLDQWQLLPIEDRKLLARFPVDEDAQIEPNFDHALFEMLRTHANVEPDWFTPEESPAWRRTDSDFQCRGFRPLPRDRSRSPRQDHMKSRHRYSRRWHPKGL